MKKQDGQRSVSYLQVNERATSPGGATFGNFCNNKSKDATAMETALVTSAMLAALTAPAYAYSDVPAPGPEFIERHHIVSSDWNSAAGFNRIFEAAKSDLISTGTVDCGFNACWTRYHGQKMIVSERHEVIGTQGYVTSKEICMYNLKQDQRICAYDDGRLWVNTVGTAESHYYRSTFPN
jgi:hypothetical protein